METTEHVSMKRTASKILEEEGFKTQKEEKIENDIVDVTAQKHGKKLAIEVGTTDEEKLQRLREKFDKVIEVGYTEKKRRSKLKGGARRQIAARVDPEIKKKLEERNINKSGLIEDLLRIYIESTEVTR